MRPPAKLARSLYFFLSLLFQQQREKVSSESARRRPRRGAGGRAGGQESKAYRPTAARHLTSSPRTAAAGAAWLSLCQCYQSHFMCAYTDTCLHLTFHRLICCQMSATSSKPWYTVRLDRRRWKGRRSSAPKGRASKTTARSGCQIRTFPPPLFLPPLPSVEWSPIRFLNNDDDAVLISKAC